ncbi:MAG: hemolysin family protein [Pseudomonadota bacterium]|nr:hemolysin family protein [Pseudomonadota bacterium]
MAGILFMKSMQNTTLKLLLTTGLWLSLSCAQAAGLASTQEIAGEYTHTDAILLLGYILLALVFSFLCSVAEAVLLSITPTYIAGLREKNPQQAAILQKLKIDNVDRSLAAILTLNTIAHTVGAIGAGAKATVVFGSAWFGVFSAIMTLLILFLSEIIPKTLGAVHWRSLTMMMAYFVRGLIFILYPLILVSELLTKLVARGREVHLFSRDEFIAMADIGEQTGGIRERESSIIQNLFRFESLKAEDIMTPRTVIVALQQDISVSDALREQPHNIFSRLPLYAANLDEITGFILKDELLLSMAQDHHDQPVKSLRREMMTVSGEMPLSGLLEKLLDQRQQIALVVNEYGGTRGLVSLEDVVETLLGMEIVDEMDRVEDMQMLARQQWKKRASARGLNIEELDQAAGAEK